MAVGARVRSQASARGAELKLYQFKKDRNLLAVSLDDKQSMLSNNLASVNGKLTDIRISRLALEAKRRMIERARDNIAEEETLPELRDNASVQCGCAKRT